MRETHFHIKGFLLCRHPLSFWACHSLHRKRECLSVYHACDRPIKTRPPSGSPPTNPLPLPSPDCVRHELYGLRFPCRHCDAALIFTPGHQVAMRPQWQPSNSCATFRAGCALVYGSHVLDRICNNPLMSLPTLSRVATVGGGLVLATNCRYSPLLGVLGFTPGRGGPWRARHHPPP